MTLRLDVAIAAPGWRAAVPEPRRLVRRAARAALAAHGGTAAGELSLVLGDDALLARLNRDFRGKDRPTNVLAFPAGEAGQLGDVVIALETASREAAAEAKPLGDHLAHLVVHGVLHLLGHDHESDPEAAAMERFEAAALAGLGIPDPYGEAPAHPRPARSDARRFRTGS